jgi:hypothetical protein
MTTSESFFFRDKSPFGHFRRLVMPALLAARRRPLESLFRFSCLRMIFSENRFSLFWIVHENGSPQAKTPAESRGFAYQGNQAGIFASSSDGSRST